MDNIAAGASASSATSPVIPDTIAAICAELAILDPQLSQLENTLDLQRINYLEHAGRNALFYRRAELWTALFDLRASSSAEVLQKLHAIAWAFQGNEEIEGDFVYADDVLFSAARDLWTIAEAARAEGGAL